MSNYTDGKKALGVGDFDKAESKLLKALDNRPDDGELWWALMLCKSGFRNDSELVDALKSDFAEAARSGDAAPSTPFDSTYCKNALRFERNGKRRAFVTDLTAELAELWAAERGKPIKLKSVGRVANVKSAHERASNAELFRLLAYISVGASAVCGALAVFGFISLTQWAMWCGAIAFLIFAVAAVVFRQITARRGGNAKYALAAVVGVFVAVCAGLFVSGLLNGRRDVMMISAAVCAVVVMAGLFRTSFNKAAARAARRDGKAEAHHTRDPVELASIADKTKRNDNSKSKSRTVDNEYKDDYD